MKSGGRSGPESRAARNWRVSPRRGLPRNAAVTAPVDFACCSPEVQPCRVHRVGGHPVAQHAGMDVLRETFRQLLPALPPVFSTVNRELALDAAVVLLAVPLISGDDVEGRGPVLD